MDSFILYRSSTFNYYRCVEDLHHKSFSRTMHHLGYLYAWECIFCEVVEKIMSSHIYI